MDKWAGLEEYIRARCDIDANGCWVWRLSTVTRGYGQGSFRGRDIACHRAVLSWKLGRDLVRGECACHSCDVPRCCNPEHLWVGNHLANMRDANEKGRTLKVSRQRMAELLQAGVPKAAVARELGCDARTVFRFAANLRG